MQHINLAKQKKSTQKINYKNVNLSSIKYEHKDKTSKRKYKLKSITQNIKTERKTTTQNIDNKTKHKNITTRKHNNKSKA